LHTELFVRCMVKMLQSLERVQISLNNLKTVILISVKEHFGRSAAERKQMAERSWKILRLIYFVSIFL